MTLLFEATETRASNAICVHAAPGRDHACVLRGGRDPLAATFILQKGATAYLTEGAPRIVRALRWLTAAYPYLWLLTDEPPTTDAGGPIDLDVDPTGTPTATSALARLLYSLPALLLAAALSLVAVCLWLAGATVILVSTKLPAPIADFLALTLRYQCRLIAYHLSLVEQYPSFDGSTAATTPPGRTFSRSAAENRST
jgi:hypothetical protein